MEDKLNIKNSAICAKNVKKTYFFAHLSKKIDKRNKMI